jgi:hypothetical protein
MRTSKNTKITTALVLVAISVPFLWGPFCKAMLRQAFPEKVLYELEGHFSFTAEPEVKEPKDLYRTGKVVLITPSRWNVYREGIMYLTRINPRNSRKKSGVVDPPMLDQYFFEIPSSMRASTPDEVETVILVEYGKQKDGTYVTVSGGGGSYSAYRRRVTFYIYDHPSGRFIGSHSFLGSAPEDETSSIGVHSGDFPEVTDFLVGLRER